MTKTELKRQLKAAKEELHKVKHELETDPEVLDKYRAYTTARDLAIRKRVPNIEHHRQKVRDIEKQLEALEKKKKDELPLPVKQYFENYISGTTTTLEQCRLRWQSEDKRFIIWTIVGSMYWSGRGEQSYSVAGHRLSDLRVGARINNYFHRERGVLYTFEGRLTNKVKAEVIKLAQDELKRNP